MMNWFDASTDIPFALEISKRFEKVTDRIWSKKIGGKNRSVIFTHECTVYIRL